MDQKKIDEYKADVPFVIRNMLKPLNNDKTWAILIALTKHKRLTFTDLKDEFKTNSPGDIDRYLKALLLAGLVEKRADYIRDIGNTEKTFYYPSPLCHALLKALNQAIGANSAKESVVKANDGGVPQVRDPPRLIEPTMATIPPTVQAVQVQPQVAMAVSTKQVIKSAPGSKPVGIPQTAVVTAELSTMPSLIARPMEKLTLEMDAETGRLLAARKSNKGALPRPQRKNPPRRKKFDPSWRRPMGHKAQLKRTNKNKAKICCGSPA